MSTAFIIDDHKDTTDMLSLYLQAEGMKTAAFNDFESALAAITRTQPCVALIDLNVPGAMDAQSFIRASRIHHPKLPVVIVSGDPRAKTAADSVNALFLLKPISLDRLVATVKEACPN